MESAVFRKRKAVSKSFSLGYLKMVRAFKSMDIVQ